MKYYVKINGVSSETIQGLKISELPSISKPLCRSTREEIDGRDGDIITKLGYSAYDKTLKIGLWGNYDINQVIAFFNQEGKITFSNEPDKYYIFTILNRADFINQLEAFRTASITIHCQPFKYMEQPSPEFDREYVEETGTDLTFNNSVEAPIVIDLKGNTSQKTLSGKNLFNQDNVSWIRNNDSNYISTTNDNTTRIRIQSPIKLEEGKTYTISGIPSGISLGVVKFYTNNSTTDNTYVNTKTFTIPTGRPNVIFQFNGENFTDSTNTLMQNADIQVELGNQATAYEEYCGGIPSPNPSYPQPVNVVSGDNDIVVEGKNLFNISTANVGKGIYNDNGNLYDANNRTTSDYIIVDENTSYIFSNIVGKAICYYNSSKVFISGGNITSSSPSITTPANTKYIRFSFDNTVDISRIMIEKGTTATTYEAYNGNTYPINLPVENLLNITNKTETINDVECKYQDGIITLNGTCSSNGFFVLNLNTSLPSGNYSLSANNQTTTNADTIIRLDSNNTNFQVRLNNANASYSGSYNATISTLTIRLNNGTQYSNFTFKPQLEKGLKVNSYTPYGTTPIELCKIGTYQDYIYKEDDKWYLHKEFEKLTFDGNEAWSLFFNTNGVFVYNPSSQSILTDDTINGISNYYTCTTRKYIRNNLSDANNVFSIYAQELVVANKSISSVADFKTWLSTHRLNVYYILKTPTNTEITYQPLLNQLNALQEASSYEGTTNIYQVNNDLPFIITASVLCGAAKFIVNNIGNTIAKPVMTIEGSGNIGIYLNNIQIFTIALGDEGSITLDIANMEAYKDGILKNRLVVGDYNSFVLQPGNNTISFSGDVVECEIKNYSRWL